MKESPAAGKVVKEENGPFGSTVWTLSNGVRVVLKPTDFKADQIMMRAFSPGGTSLFGTKEPLQLKMLNEVAGVGGLGNFSNVDLEKVLAGKKASVSAFVNGLSEGLSGSCSPKDMETLMQLVYLSFTAPRMDQDAFTSFKNRAKANLANQEANPMTALTDSIQFALYGNHPLAMRVKAEMIDNVDYKRIMDMYADRFKEAGDFTFLFVGNINLEEAKPMIETYLGGLPTIKRTENFTDVNMNFRKGEYKNVFNKELGTPMATVIVVAHGNCDYSLKSDILMKCLSRTLDMVYLEEVREKEGGTYGVQTVGQLTRYPKDEALLQVVFNTDPTKREMLMGIIMGELQRVAKEGPKEEHLAKVKEAMVKQYAESVKENSYWLGVLNNYYWYNEDMDSKFVELVNSITVKDVQKFAKQLFDQGNLIEVCMTDESAK